MSFFDNFKDNILRTFTTSSKERDIYNNTTSTDDKSKHRKSKEVSFGDIKIIDVESYKLYNQLDEIYLEENDHFHIKCCDKSCKCEIC